MRVSKNLILAFALAIGGAVVGHPGKAVAKTVIDQWDSIKEPPPPVLKSVKADPKTMALLVLDVVQKICGSTPECIASLPKMSALLKEARAHHMPVIYSSVHGQTAENVMKEVAPLASEPMVSSHADKFIGTDLAALLKKLNVKTVIVVGTAADGAVMYTGSHAAFLGYKVIVPVDGATSRVPYADKAAMWIMTHAPAVGDATTLTSFDKISW